jgi:hypothetical protein
MEWTRKEKVELFGFTFEAREMTLAIQKEIDAAVKAGGSVVDETLRRCVYFEGEPLGDRVGNLGYSVALPLVEKVQSLANMNPDLVAKARAESLGSAALELDAGGGAAAAPATANGTGAPVPKA